MFPFNGDTFAAFSVGVIVGLFLASLAILLYSTVINHRAYRRRK